MRARRSPLLPVAAIAAFSVFGSSASARADVTLTKDQCIDANGEGQELRREGKLSGAREKLLLCANQACPEIVRDDCNRRLDELERVQPTIAFEAKDASGADVTAVKVMVDGKPLADVLDGTALRVDVGRHVFTFEVIGSPPVTRTLVMTEGEKGRREVVKMGMASSKAPIQTSAAATTTSPPAEAPPTVREKTAAPASTIFSDSERTPTSGGVGTQKVLGLVTGGLGLAGLAIGGVFGLLTMAEKTNLQNDCPPTTCTGRGHASGVADYSNGMTDSTISTAGFIAGGALLVGGAVLFFTASPASEVPSAAAMRFAPSVGTDGAGMLMRGVF